jgi:hypothetical protein
VTPDPLQATINLPLAKLMMLTEDIDHKLEISDLICKQISNDTGILSFQIGVKIDKQILSEEVARSLNPVLVCLEYAKDLPEESESNQNQNRNQNRDAVCGSISVFGQNSSSPPANLTNDGLIQFNHYKFFFVGKWLQHHLREYLQTTPMLV